MHRQGSETWLEPVLEHHLAHVSAPEELWERIQFPRAHRPETVRGGRVAFALAAVLGITIAALSFPPTHVLRSNQGSRIRAWVKANTGLDIPLRPQTILTGARIIRARVPTAEIEYQAGNHHGALRVSKAGSLSTRGPQHGAWPMNTSAVSWEMRGQLYTLSCPTPEDLRIACQLCHAGVEWPADSD